MPNGVDRHFSDRHDPLLIPLADHGDEALFQVELLKPQIAELRESKARGIGELQNRLIAIITRAHLGRLAQEPLDLVALQSLRERIPAARQGKIFGDVEGEHLLRLAKLEERLERRDHEVQSRNARLMRFGPFAIQNRALLFLAQKLGQV